MSKVLIVEDDEILNDGLSYNLLKRDLIPSQAHSLAEAEKLLSEASFDLILLDINLPDGDGFRFAEEKLTGCGTPFIFLTAHNLDDEIINGYRLGADDYITKPFSIGIVMEKISAVLRRCEGAKENPVYSCGRLEINFDSRTVRKDGEPLSLTPTEFALLQIFCRHRRQILTKEILLDNIWDSKGNYVNEHTLSLNISRLRHKIADKDFIYIKTIYGMGYKWIGSEEDKE